MKAQIEVYEDKAGSFRWNVSVIKDNDFDIVCQSTNHHETFEAAEDEARAVICQAWEVDNG